MSRVDMEGAMTDEGRPTYKRHIKGVRIVDLTLADLGREMVEVRAIYDDAKRKLEMLETEQQRRIDKLMKVKHLDWQQVSDTEAIVTNPRPFPTETQRPIFDLFDKAWQFGDASLLTQVYELGCEMRCQFTSWESEHGESFDVAYARRMEVIASAEDDSVDATGT